MAAERGLHQASGFEGTPDDQSYVRTADPQLAAYEHEFLGAGGPPPTPRPPVGCITPAYNEAETIAGVLDSLLQQTRLPDVVRVIVNNTSDDSVEVASHYAGPHTRVTPP